MNEIKTTKFTNKQLITVALVFGIIFLVLGSYNIGKKVIYDSVKQHYENYISRNCVCKEKVNNNLELIELNFTVAKT